MSEEHSDGYRSQKIPAYVLDEHTSDDVSKAMMERGEQTQSFYIFNMDEAHHRMQYFQQKMPRVKIYYAMKSNDTDMMLRLAVAIGLGFDCASPGEIHKIRSLGVNPRSIIYAVPCKSPEEMKYARNMGVQHTTFDCSGELLKIRESWPEAKLLIRIKIDGKSKIMLGLKFGCDFKTHAIRLLEQAASLGLNVVGVAFHVGSLCFSPESYVLGLQNARALFNHEAKNGRRMYIVDIGGGYLSNRTDSIDEVSALVNKALEELFPDPTVQVIAEPGGYICDSAFKMFCRVVGVRQVFRDNVLINLIYLNNGIHGSFRCDENWHKVCKVQRSAEIEPIVDEDVILWGPTCDTNDCMLANCGLRLPRCNPNDWLAVDNHGAYTITFASEFSCIKPPFIRTVVSKKVWSFIMNSPVFQPSDFVLSPDISAPLPSTLPPVLPTCVTYVRSEILH